MERITTLYKQLPKKKKPMRQQQSKVLQETDTSRGNDCGNTVSVSTGNGPSTVLSSPKQSKTTSSKLPSSSTKKSKDKNRRPKTFNLEKERPHLLQTIASASVAATNLLNALKLVNRENQQVSQDPQVMERFELCKNLRRQILRYIQHVESDDFLGSLIHANEELVNALIAFEVLDKSVDDDSDSDNELVTLGSGNDSMNESFSGLSIEPPPKPPRPSRPTSLSIPTSANAYGKQRVIESSESEDYISEDDDEDNPFGDRNAVSTPYLEKSEPTWYVSSKFQTPCEVKADKHKQA